MRGCKAQVTSTYGNVTGILGRKPVSISAHLIGPGMGEGLRNCVCGAYNTRTTDRSQYIHEQGMPGGIPGMEWTEQLPGYSPFECGGCAQQAYRNVLLTLSARSLYRGWGWKITPRVWFRGLTTSSVPNGAWGIGLLVTSILPPLNDRVATL